jgi:hypothetical protein
VAVAPGGEWLVVGGGGPDLLAGYALSPEGVMLGELDLSVPTATRYRFAEAAAVPDGGWVVAWGADLPDDGPASDEPPIPQFQHFDTYVARFGAGGERLAGPVRANEERVYDQDPAGVGVGPETVVVLWDGYTGESRLGEGRARVLDLDDLSFRTGEIAVNPERTERSEQRFFELVMAPEGGFLAAWTGLEGERDGVGVGSFADAVWLQAFAADGSKAGPDRLANVITAGAQDLRSAAVTGDGTVWLLWTDFGVQSAEPRPVSRLVARPFSLDGLPLGGEVEIGPGSSFFDAQVAGGTAAALALWDEDGAWLAEVLDGGLAEAAPADELALTSPELSGFRVWVRLSAPGVSIWGTEEPLCIPETLCASGALPGRTEVLVRIVGPKGNGFLWPTLVKLTTSQVEVWLEQTSTGDVQFYLLPGASPGNDVLHGLFDRDGFRP